MNVTREPTCKPLRNKPLKAGLLLGVFLFLLAMAQFKALHHFLHAGAEAPDQEAETEERCSEMAHAPELSGTGRGILR